MILHRIERRWGRATPSLKRTCQAQGQIERQLIHGKREITTRRADIDRSTNGRPTTSDHCIAFLDVQNGKKGKGVRLKAVGHKLPTI